MINRNNYEEFLLMYVDGELTPQQRTAVELFVQQNPDLLPELETLQQTILSTEDENIFMDKSSLLKINSSISIDNYEEYFLLDIDKELDTAAKNEVEKFVLQHPELQEQFTILKQTVLAPEVIIFTDKQSLYRKEERRLVPLNWMRFAAAAAVIGFAVMVWWLMPGKKMNENELATVKPSVEKTVPATGDTDKTNQPQTVDILPNNNEVAAVKQDATENKNTAVKTQKVNKVQQQVNDNVAVNNVAEKLSNNPAVKEPIPAPKEELIAYNPPVVDNNTNTSTQTGFENAKQNDIAANTLVQPAVYKELDTDSDAGESLYVGNVNLNKNKLRGVLKKVGGLFAAKAKTATASNEEGKLQVANLEFNKN